MKTTKIIVSIALANVLLVAGIAYFFEPNKNTYNTDLILNKDTSSTTDDSSPTTTSAQQPKQNTSPKPLSNQCIITISGIKYDVQPLRSTHSGGDVFVCNTDMTKIFFGQHEQALLNGEMQKYRLP